MADHGASPQTDPTKCQPSPKSGCSQALSWNDALPDNRLQNKLQPVLLLLLGEAGLAAGQPARVACGALHNGRERVGSRTPKPG